MILQLAEFITLWNCSDEFVYHIKWQDLMIRLDDNVITFALTFVPANIISIKNNNNNLDDN